MKNRYTIIIFICTLITLQSCESCDDSNLDQTELNTLKVNKDQRLNKKSIDEKNNYDGQPVKEEEQGEEEQGEEEQGEEGKKELESIKSTINKLNIFKSFVVKSTNLYGDRGNIFILESGGKKYCVKVYNTYSGTSVESSINHNVDIAKKIGNKYDSSPVIPVLPLFLKECEIVNFKIDYIEKNFLIFPFIEGKNLNQYDFDSIDKLKQTFQNLFLFFEKFDYPHTDLNTNNIIVNKDGNLFIVDWDKMSKTDRTSFNEVETYFAEIYSCLTQKENNIHDVDYNIELENKGKIIFLELFREHAPKKFEHQKDYWKKMFDQYAPTDRVQLQKYLEEMPLYKWLVDNFGWTKSTTTSS